MLKNFPNFPKSHLIAAGSLSLAIGTALLLSPSKDVEAKRISIPLEVSSTSRALDASGNDHIQTTSSFVTAPVAQSSVANDTQDDLDAAAPIDPQTAQVSANGIAATRIGDDLKAQQPSTNDEVAWQTYKVGNGDSLATLFKRAGLSSQDVHEVVQADKEKLLRRIYPGNTLDVDIKNGQLQKLRLQLNKLESVMVARDEAGKLRAGKQVLEPEAHTSFGAGTITSSLFQAGQEAGLSQSMIMNLANIFGYDVDFALDIRDGDNFNVVYEELYLDGKKVGYGDILAASFTNQGKTYTAVRYKDRDGHVSYYRPDGQSLRKAFIRTPVDFARISSPFNLGRRHPVLNKIRAHKGTDYAAPSGTPIKAAGDGKVIFAGVKGGYGNVVILQHGQSITTVYGHMKAFARGIRVGTKVDQSQIIGYVGQTGLATGPHLHYEFRVSGTPKNPVTVKLPMAAPIAASEMARFKQQSSVQMAQLETYSQSYRVALNGH